MAYIGIDLGTTNSVAAILNPKTRRVQVLSIEREGANLPPGERELIRSVVASQNGQYLKGWKALAYAKRDPKNTIFSVKRLMGRGYNDRQEYGVGRNRGRLIRELMCENWSMEIVNPEEATKDALAVLLEGREHFPQEISMHILLEIKRVAEEACGERVEGAVITVPAYFNEKQCSATIEAALKAGIPIQRILPEPTAAAKAYARDTLSLTPRTVLVYDLGGGTFDVSLLTIAGPNIRVDTIDGDNWLGGDDFDREIVNDLVELIKIKTGKNPKNDPGLMFELRMRAEKAKKELSDEHSGEIIISDLFPGCSAVTLFREKEKLKIAIKSNSENTYIPRSYEEMISEYIEETIQLVNSVLKSKLCEPDDIDKVLLVGGATKTPLIRKRLAEIFGEDKLETRKVDTMLAVAIGAAYASYDDFEGEVITCPWFLEDGKPCLTKNKVGTKTCIKCGKPLVIVNGDGDITERPYGIEIRDNQKGRNVFDVIIPKDERYPLKTPAKRIFYVGKSGTRMLKVRFFAGTKWDDEDFHKEVEKNEHVGTVWMVLPSETPEGAEVEIGFNLNKNKVMVDISIKCEGKVLRKQMISRGEKDEALGLRIEKAIEKIQILLNERKIKDDKAKQLMDTGLSAMELIIESYTVSGEQNKEGLLSEAEQKIKTMEVGCEDGTIDPFVDPFAFAKNMRIRANFVLQEYAWLPFLQDENFKAEIKEELKELKMAITSGEEAIEQKDERATKRALDKAMDLTAELGALLFADRAFIMLETLRIAILVAKGEFHRGTPGGIIIPERVRDVSQNAGSAEGLQDAKVMQENLNMITVYLQAAGRETDDDERKKKIQKAEFAYRQIEPLIFKWIIRVGI